MTRIKIAAVSLAAVLAVLLLLPPGGLRALAGQVVAQAPAHYVYSNTAKVTCAATSTALVAASATQPRRVLIYVPAAATAGVHVGMGAAATTDMMLVEPGKSLEVSGLQAVNCLRAGGSDVVTYAQTAFAGGYVP